MSNELDTTASAGENTAEASYKTTAIPDEQTTSTAPANEVPVDGEIDPEIEEEEDWSALNPVDEQLLATMSENGNYESIVMHMKAGNVVPITKDMLSSLVQQFDAVTEAENKYTKLLSNLQYIVRAVNPLLARRQELQEYFDADNPHFINLGKLMGEFMGAAPKLMGHFMNPLPNKGKLEFSTPLLQILSNFDKTQLEHVDLDSLLQAVNDSGVPTHDLVKFWEEIGGKKFFAKKEEVGNAK